jgi:hypothetical protein
MYNEQLYLTIIGTLIKQLATQCSSKHGSEKRGKQIYTVVAQNISASDDFPVLGISILFQPS